MKNFIFSPESPAEDASGNATFAGTLRRYFIDEDAVGSNVGISKRWNDATKDAFANDYNNRLIPVIEKLYGRQRALGSFNEDEFNQILAYLRDRYRYSDNTMLHYRHLLWVVYRAGFENGLFNDNIFWDDVMDPEEMSEKQKENYYCKMMTQLRKSFSAAEEIKIIKWFQKLDPIAANGEDIGLAIMFFCGLRNSEACGLDYGNLYLLDGHSDAPVLEVVKTTNIESNKLKAGGKTSNAPRVIPVFLPLFDFLIRRKAYLEGRLTDGKLAMPNGSDVAQLCIVCTQDNYLIRASADDLSKRGREFFAKIGIDKSELTALHQILVTKEFSDTKIDEKEPTAYLFRRNFATHLYQMGFLSAEIQYLMGHAIETPGMTRNMFADEDTLYDISMKLHSSPYYQFFGDDSSSQVPGSISMPVEGDGSYLLDILADEPLDEIAVNITGKGLIVGLHTISRCTAVQYNEKVQITEIQAKVYKQKVLVTNKH